VIVLAPHPNRHHPRMRVIHISFQKGKMGRPDKPGDDEKLE
jgi:hypothetical protein